MRLLIYLMSVALTIAFFKTVESKMTIDQVKNTLKPFKNSCLKKTSTDPDLVEGTKRGEFPPERSLMCFARCVMQMMKIMKNGEINLTSLLQQIDMMMPDEYVDRMKSLVTLCSERAAPIEDSCEAAFTFLKCFYETDSELYFFP